MSTAEQAVETFSIVIPLYPSGPQIISDYIELFPLNPNKYGQMTAYDPARGLKSCTTHNAAPQPEDLEKNLRLNGHQGRIGYLPGFADSTNVGCVDIDLKHFASAEDFEKVVSQVTTAMQQNGITWYRENSTNGGAHLWVFLESALSYGRVRDFLKGIIKEAGQPKLETYPAGAEASSKWVFMPYAGALANSENLGLTYLQDSEGEPIPFWQLGERIKRTPMSKVDAVLARQAAVTQQEPQQSTAGELSPEGFTKLKEAVLQPPEGFQRHDSIEAFLNLAERMGKQAEMADFLNSEEVYSVWIADGSRTREAWAEEIDRWIEGSYGDHQHGIKFLLDQGFNIPDLPKVGEAASRERHGKLNWQQAFDELQLRYAGHKDESGTKRRIRRLRPSDFHSLPKLEPLIGNLLIEGTLAALLGQSGAGKSMIALDMALHIATGTEWQGRSVRQGPVAWLAAESMEYTFERLAAWCNKNEVNLDDLPFELLDGYLSMTDVEREGGLEELILTLKEVEQDLGPLKLIVVDTVARTFDGDENSNDDMKRYTDAAELLVRIFKCTVLLIHHTGKDASKGARGASAFKAPLTTELTVHPKVGGVELKQSKNRGGSDEHNPIALTFQTHHWEVAGEERKAGVVIPMILAEDVLGNRLSEKQQVVYDCFVNLAVAHPEGTRIARADWNAAVEKKYPDFKPTTMRDCIKRLVDLDLVKQHGIDRQATFELIEGTGDATE